MSSKYHVSGGILSLCLAAVLLFSPCVAVRADTVVTDPNGRTLCVGRAVVNVDFSRANFDDNLKKLKEVRCLIMGLIGGRVVVAALKQEEQPDLKDKLFFVTLEGRNNGGIDLAKFSGLISDQICIKKSVHPLSDYVRWEYKTLFTYRNDGQNRSYGVSIPRGQLIPWDGKDAKGNPNHYVFMINGYQKSISVFSLKEASTNEKIGILELEYARELLLPAWNGVKYFDWNINVLDCISLNNLRDQSNKKNYPPALMVWCKEDMKTGQELSQLTAPTRVLACSIDDAVQSVTINSSAGFDFVPFRDPWKESTNLLNGFVVAPDKDGSLSYWACDEVGEYSTLGGSHFTFRVYKMPIVLVKEATSRGEQVGIGPATVQCSWRGSFGLATNKYSEGGNTFIWDSVYTKNAGLRILFKDHDNEVGVTPDLMPDKDPYDAGTDRIGELEVASEAELKEVNSESQVLGGPIPSSPADRLKRVADVEGWTVLRVIMGEPYVVAAEGQLPDSMTSTWTYQADKTKVAEETFNNGFSMSRQFGVGDEGASFGSFDSGVKSQYESKNTDSKGDESIVTKSWTYSNGTPKFYESGAVFYTKTKPRVYSLARVIPNKTTPFLRLANGSADEKFNLFLINAAAQPVDSGSPIRVQEFKCADPSKTISSPTPDVYYDREDRSDKAPAQFSTDYAVLSAGLLPRPISSLIQGVNTKEAMNQGLKQIVEWESKNNIIRDIKGFCADGRGVQSYASYALKGDVKNWVSMYDGSVVVPFNLSSTYSIACKHTEKDSRSEERGAGVYLKLGLGIFKYESEYMYKSGSERVNSDTEQDMFQVSIPGLTGDNLDKTRSYYYFWVDVPSMKSYMASHEYTLVTGENAGTFKNVVRRPSFIPAYAWESDQSFMLGVPWIEIGVNSPAQPGTKKSSKL